MIDATAEVIAVGEALPPAKRTEVADFKKFILTQESDARWDHTAIRDFNAARRLAPVSAGAYQCRGATYD